MQVHYNQIPQKIVIEQAEIIFKELSNGIYESIKCQESETERFVSSNLVISMLNRSLKVYVIGLHGTYYNFEIEGFGHCLENKRL